MLKSFCLGACIFIVFASLPMRGTIKAHTVFLCNACTDSIPVFFIKAKDHKSSNLSQEDSTLRLMTGLYNDYYLTDSSTGSGYLYIDLTVIKSWFSKVRTPLNISLVIDRSGSMAGDKIESAKKVAKEIVNKLDSTDFISLVIYDNFINLIQKAVRDTNKSLISKKIDLITARGSTDLWGGAEKGYEQVLMNYRGNFINRVLLVSDGVANVGVTNPEVIKHKVQQFRDSGVSISTFGVGLDYNEFLMTQMAEMGSGNYYFIDTTSKMNALFDQELKGMLRMAASNANLFIQLPEGIKLDAVYPSKFQKKGSLVQVNLHDLFAGDEKSELIKFSFPIKIKTPLQFRTTVSYKNISDGISKNLLIENRLLPAKDINVYEEHFNKDVIEQVLLYMVSEWLEKAMIEIEAGNYEKARESLNSNISLLKTNRYYVKTSTALQKLESSTVVYLNTLFKKKRMIQDSLKKMQKENGDLLYKIRNKKN